ncbi:hypothetical protein GCM10027610_012830 [Dactylosporangium cerinum]
MAQRSLGELARRSLVLDAQKVAGQPGVPPLDAEPVLREAAGGRRRHILLQQPFDAGGLVRPRPARLGLPIGDLEECCVDKRRMGGDDELSPPVGVGAGQPARYAVEVGVQQGDDLGGRSAPGPQHVEHRSAEPRRVGGDRPVQGLVEEVQPLGVGVAQRPQRTAKVHRRLTTH